MALFLLDSNIIIDVLNAKRNRSQLIRDLLLDGEELACTSINITEVYMGLRPGEEVQTADFLSDLIFIPVSPTASRLAGKLFREWRAKGQTLSFTDLTIAAVCLVGDITLITNNIKHFPMPELKLHSLP